MGVAGESLQGRAGAGINQMQDAGRPAVEYVVARRGEAGGEDAARGRSGRERAKEMGVRRHHLEGVL